VARTPFCQRFFIDEFHHDVMKICADCIKHRNSTHKFETLARKSTRNVISWAKWIWKDGLQAKELALSRNGEQSEDPRYSHAEGHAQFFEQR
jgi:hypothetical protein